MGGERHTPCSSPHTSTCTLYSVNELMSHGYNSIYPVDACQIGILFLFSSLSLHTVCGCMSHAVYLSHISLRNLVFFLRSQCESEIFKFKKNEHKL